MCVNREGELQREHVLHVQCAPATPNCDTTREETHLRGSSENSRCRSARAFSRAGANVFLMVLGLEELFRSTLMICGGRGRRKRIDGDFVFLVCVCVHV